MKYASYLLSTFKGVCPLLLTRPLLLNFYHIRFSQDLHMGIPFQCAAGTEKHQHCEMVFLNFINRGRGFTVFFKPFSKNSCRFPNSLTMTIYIVTLVSIYNPLLCVIVSLPFGVTRRFLIVLPSLNCTCVLYLQQMF